MSDTNWKGSESMRDRLVAIDTLHTDPANVRTHGEKNLAAIKHQHHRVDRMGVCHTPQNERSSSALIVRPQERSEQTHRLAYASRAQAAGQLSRDNLGQGESEAAGSSASCVVRSSGIAHPRDRDVSVHQGVLTLQGIRATSGTRSEPDIRRITHCETGRSSGVPVSHVAAKAKRCTTRITQNRWMLCGSVVGVTRECMLREGN